MTKRLLNHIISRWGTDIVAIVTLASIAAYIATRRYSAAFWEFLWLGMVLLNDKLEKQVLLLTQTIDHLTAPPVITHLDGSPITAENPLRLTVTTFDPEAK